MTIKLAHRGQSVCKEQQCYRRIDKVCLFKIGLKVKNWKYNFPKPQF